MDEKKLLELSEYIVSKGQQLGASDVEVLSSSSSEVDAVIQNGEISGVERRIADAIAIRLYIGKKMGSAFTNIPTKKAADEAVAMALASAKVTTEDAEWVSLAEPNEYPTINGLWNKDIAKVEPARAVELAWEFMEMATQAEEGLIASAGGTGVGLGHSAFANSNGISHMERGNVAYAFLGVLAKIEQGVTPEIYGYNVRRSMDLGLEESVEDIVSLIRVCKNTVEGESGEFPVVLHPWASSQILRYTFLQAVKGDNVARGKSKLKGKIGETIAPDHFNIVDDGTIPTGINTSIADDEGVPRQRTPLIERGVLGSFLWDTYWANKTGAESTGNAKRNMRQGLVDIGFTNTVVEPGRRKIQDIVSEIDKGYLIRNVQGAHSSNPESGDFSVVGNPAVLIEDGEMVGAVHGLMIAGNAFELLNKCIEIAEEPIAIGGFISPELVFEGVNVITRGHT